MKILILHRIRDLELNNMAAKHIKRQAVSGNSFKELATSRRSIRRVNHDGGDTLGLLDEESQVLYVTKKSELWELIVARQEQGAARSSSHRIDQMD